jgi:hypothetical protein
MAGGAEGGGAGPGGLAGVVAMIAMAFEGHGLFELPVFTHLGLCSGRTSPRRWRRVSSPRLVRVEAGWMRIGWRVVASWIGAILMLTLAFEVTGALS